MSDETGSGEGGTKKTLSRREFLKLSTVVAAAMTKVVAEEYTGAKTGWLQRLLGKKSETVKKEQVAEKTTLVDWGEEVGSRLHVGIMPMEAGEGVTVETMSFMRAPSLPRPESVSFQKESGVREAIVEAYKRDFPEEKVGGAYVAKREEDENKIVQVLSEWTGFGGVLSRVFKYGPEGKLEEVLGEQKVEDEGVLFPYTIKVTRRGIAANFAPIYMPDRQISAIDAPEFYRSFTGFVAATEGGKETVGKHLPAVFVDQEGQQHQLGESRLYFNVDQLPEEQYFLPLTIDETNCDRPVWDVHGSESLAGGVSSIARELYTRLGSEDTYYPRINYVSDEGKLEQFWMWPRIEGWGLETYAAFEGKKGKLYVQETRVKPGSDEVLLRVVQVSDGLEVARRQTQVTNLNGDSLHRICSGASDKMVVTALLPGGSDSKTMEVVTTEEGTDGQITWKSQTVEIPYSVPGEPGLKVKKVGEMWNVKLSLVPEVVTFPEPQELVAREIGWLSETGFEYGLGRMPKPKGVQNGEVSA